MNKVHAIKQRTCSKSQKAAQELLVTWGLYCSPLWGLCGTDRLSPRLYRCR